MTRFFVFACSILSGCAASMSASDLAISINELLSLPNSSGSYPWAINNQGQVVGETDYSVDGAYYYHATVWTAGIPQDIHDPTFEWSAAYGINDAGEVAGEAGPMLAYSNAFIWRGGAMQSITGGENDYIQGADAINNSGIVVGQGGLNSFGYRWQNGFFQSLGILSSDWSARPSAINDRGEVVGSIYGRSGRRAVIWTGTSPTTIPAPGSVIPCEALAINVHSEVVGTYSYSPKPFVWSRADGARPLPLPAGARNAYPLSINADGAIVGDIDGRPALWVKIEGSYEVFYVDDYLPIDAGWTGVGLSAINDRGQIAGWGTRNGSDRAIILEFSLAAKPEIELRRVDRDDPFPTWSSATVVTDPQPIYAGDATGDLVSWRIKNPPRGATFKWTATQIEGLARKTISGPQGVDKNEWLLNDGSFVWAPGTYRIECVITPESGSGQSLTTDQVIGWRTQEYLVVGQIKPIHDFDLNDFRELILKTALIRSYDFGNTYLTAATKITLFHYPMGLNMKIWVALQFLRYDAAKGEPAYVELRGVKDTEKYWMIQQLLDEFPDLVDLPGSLDAATIQLLKEQRSYRMYGRVQYRYRLSAQGRIDPSSVMYIRREWDSGPTKFLPALKRLSGTEITARGVELTVNENADQMWISSESIPDSGGIFINAQNTSLSFYFGGRVGLEGRVPNYALLHRDAPFIFTEIVSALGPDGRDTGSKIRLSVDKTWKPDDTITGTTHFNEIRIYKRNFRDDEHRFDLVKLFRINGQFKGFLLSGSTTWPGAAPAPKGDN